MALAELREGEAMDQGVNGTTGRWHGAGALARIAGVILCAVAGLAPTTSAQTTPSTFTYQGRLDRGGLAYSGPAMVRMRVFPNALDDGDLISSNEIQVNVVNGLFSFDTDLGTAELLQPLRFVQIEVKSPDMEDFQSLERRLVRGSPIAGAAYRAMFLDSVGTSASPFPTRFAVQRDASNYTVADHHWQGFPSGSGGLLTQIAVVTRFTGASAGATLRIYLGQGPTGTLIHTQKVYLPAASEEALLQVIPAVTLNPDTYYSWDIQTASGVVGLAHASGDPDPVTISSLGATDYAYTTYFGEEGNMTLRARRLGVGVGSPLAGLHVLSEDTNEAARFESTSSMGTTVAIKGMGGQPFELLSTGAAWSDGAGKLLVRRPGGGSTLALTDDGVGINTANPGATLHVIRSGAAEVGRFASSSAIGTKLLLENTSVAGTTWVLGSMGSGSAEGAGTLTVSNSATRVTITPAGRVGIGTAPSTMLHVAGGTDASLGGGGYVQSGVTSGANIVIDDNEILARNNGAGSTLFLNAEGAGVGVGGSTPAQATLHVQSGGNLSQSQSGYVQIGQAGETNLALDTNEIQVLNNGAASLLFLNYRGGQVSIGEPGNTTASALVVQGQALKPGGGSWSVLSDRRAKTNVEPLRGTLDRLLSLHGYSYQYTDEALKQGGALPGTQIGLMAQEVQRVFPGWVNTDDQGRLNVTERATTALMVEALRDLRAEKDAADAALRSELDAAEARVQALEAENAAMRARLERLERAIEMR